MDTDPHKMRVEFTMPRNRRKFTDEFRAEVVGMIRRGDRSVAQVCKDLDLVESAVRRWLKSAESAPGQPGEAVTAAERDELKRLRREVQTLRMERDILKKAAAFFAKESR